MKKTIILRGFLGLILTIIPFQVFSFWIGTEALVDIPGNDGIGGIHQGITADAAEIYIYEPTYMAGDFCENGCSFTQRAIQELRVSNVEIDGGSSGDKPSFHCDDEKIQECSNIIYNGIRKIIKRLVNVSHDLELHRNSSVDFQLTRTLFGNISHTLQDFYSHSNWVEMNSGLSHPVVTPYDFNGEMLSVRETPVHKNLITKNFKYPLNIFESRCRTTPKDQGIEGTAISLIELTSGHYHDTPDIWGIDITTGSLGFRSTRLSKNGPYFPGWGWKTIPGYVTELGGIVDILYFYSFPRPTLSGEKCQHGDKYNNLTGFTSNHFGIAKDSPRRRFHAQAKDVATRATTEMIERIVSGVKEEYGSNIFSDAAILGFLGHEPCKGKVFPSHAGFTYECELNEVWHNYRTVDGLLVREYQEGVETGKTMEYLVIDDVAEDEAPYFKYQNMECYYLTQNNCLVIFSLQKNDIRGPDSIFSVQYYDGEDFNSIGIIRNGTEYTWRQSSYKEDGHHRLYITYQRGEEDNPSDVYGERPVKDGENWDSGRFYWEIDPSGERFCGSPRSNYKGYRKIELESHPCYIAVMEFVRTARITPPQRESVVPYWEK